MLLIRVPLIVSVLGFTILSACSDPVKPLDIKTRPVNMPELVLPSADPVKTRTVEWIVLTEENFEEVFAKLRNSGKDVVLFGLTAQGYENLSLNANDLRTYIQQQNSIILAYNNYYIRSRDALTGAVIVQ